MRGFEHLARVKRMEIREVLLKSFRCLAKHLRDTHQIGGIAGIRRQRLEAHLQTLESLLQDVQAVFLEHRSIPALFPVARPCATAPAVPVASGNSHPETPSTFRFRPAARVPPRAGSL